MTEGMFVTAVVGLVAIVAIAFNKTLNLKWGRKGGSGWVGNIPRKK